MQYIGVYELPELSEADQRKIEEEEWHKVVKTEHVQAMNQLVSRSVDVGPGDLEGVVFQFQHGVHGTPNEYAYAVVTEDGPEPEFQAVEFLGNLPTFEEIRALNRMSRDEALIARAMYAPASPSRR